MHEDTPHRNDLTKLVPRGLLRVIKTHFDDSVAEAVKRYRFNALDEDSLTGALGQALSTPERIVSTVNGSHFSFAIESYKILGKGPGTPEKRMGADGIFQLCVWEGEDQIFGKGLPFQAKREDRYRLSEVIKQAEDLYRTSETGIILRYSPEGYHAADVRHLLHKEHPKALQTSAGYVTLGTGLGDWFIQRKIGRIGLSFAGDKPDPREPEKQGTWVINTDIRKTSDTPRPGASS